MTHRAVGPAARSWQSMRMYGETLDTSELAPAITAAPLPLPTAGTVSSGPASSRQPGPDKPHPQGMKAITTIREARSLRRNGDVAYLQPDRLQSRHVRRARQGRAYVFDQVLNESTARYSYTARRSCINVAPTTCLGDDGP